MHVLYIIILFAIPSLILAEKCPKQLQNQRTKIIQTIWSCCPGYKQGSDGNCNPICNTPCVNGKCGLPNVCRCDEGYQNMNNDTSKRCLPACKVGCEEAHCVSPGKCDKCKEGYLMEGNECVVHKKSDDYRMSNTTTPRTEPTTSAESIFNAWTVGGAIFILIVVILAITAYVIYRVLYHKSNRYDDMRNQI